MYANRTEIFSSIMSSITGKEMTIKMRKKREGEGRVSRELTEKIGYTRN